MSEKPNNRTGLIDRIMDISIIGGDECGMLDDYETMCPVTDGVLAGTLADCVRRDGYRKVSKEVGMATSALNRFLTGKGGIGPTSRTKIYRYIDPEEMVKKMGRPEVKKTVFSRAIEEITQKRATAADMDYNGLLEKCGASSAVWESARKAYVRACDETDWDRAAELGMMRADLFNKICMGFMLNPDEYKVENPPTVDKAHHAQDGDDLTLLLESMHNQQELTNQLLREIRSAIDSNTAATRTSDIVSKVDRILGCCNVIKDNSTHFPEIKKKAIAIEKAVISIDQRINGINQIIASHKIDVGKIKTYVERFTSGK